jgi:pyruvate dehydrogenase E2 component (dihydrolipoamide acetyltransferase)
MPVEITMPRLSDTMEQGTVVSWNVAEGDDVSAGDVLGDIETDKATMELQNFDDGTVAWIALDEGSTVDVGSLIMVLAEDGEDPAEIKQQFQSGGGAESQSGGERSTEQSASASGGNGSASSSNGAATATAERPAASAGGDDTSDPQPSGDGDGDGQDQTRGEGGGRIFASPLARKIAADEGLDLASIEGTGPSGRIVRKDVEAALSGDRPRRSAQPQPSATASQPAAQPDSPSPAAAPLPDPGAPLPAGRVKLSNMRSTIARRLVEAKQAVPHYQVTVSARVDDLLDLRAQLNEQLAGQNVKLSVNDFIVRACALAMHEHPFTNASWGDDGASITIHERVNIGVAIAIPINPEDLSGGGLVVGALKDADRMGLRQISAETKRLAKKAREKGLTIDEMSDATFTISNLGMYGVEHFTAIINPPNAAILAVGGAVKKPIIVQDEDGDDAITVGHEMQMTMSSDHRVIDGAMAAEYLNTVKRMLEAPATLLV